MTEAEPAADNLTAEVPARLVVGFVRQLRGAGVAVPGGAATSYARALAAVGLRRRVDVYWAGRATLVHQLDDVAAYDAVFERFWVAGRLRDTVPTPGNSGADDEGPGPAAVPGPSDGGDGGMGTAHDRDAGGPAAHDGALGTDGDDRLVAVGSYTSLEVLRTKDFAACTEGELERLHRLLGTLRFTGARRTSRRRRPARRGDRLDLRLTVRGALRTEGEALRRAWSATTTRPRRLVFVCDVSGSMAPYARAMLHFGHAAVACHRPVEVFTVGTRLTRVTSSLAHRDPDVALARASSAVPDWSGGTRLGDALSELVQDFGSGASLRGAVVVVLSDGWDCGDTTVMARSMQRLHLLAHRVVWVNPWKASPGFAPVARGMAAALPHVDELVEGHSFDSLDALAGTVLR